MQALMLEERTLSELDHIRLSRLVRPDWRGPFPPSTPLDAVLESADVLPWHQVPADVVTMHSRVLLIDLASGARKTVTLCYPADAEPHSGFVSVLSPVGSSVLGLRTGCVATWRTPDGGKGAAEIAEILFQPESHGVGAGMADTRERRAACDALKDMT